MTVVIVRARTYICMRRKLVRMPTFTRMRTRKDKKAVSAAIISVMSSSGVVRLHDQLRAVWKSRDNEEPVVRGYLLLGSGNEKSVAERWFVLVGHSFFYTIHRGSPEYSGALLADIFSPVATRVDEKTLEKFTSTSDSAIQVHNGGSYRMPQVQCMSILYCTCLHYINQV